MRLVIQECLKAHVEIDKKIISSISRGEVVLVAFTQGDDINLIHQMVDKLLKLRIFPDDEGKTNLSIADIKGEILAVSQFTLYADVSKGNRPSFVKSLSHDAALPLYEEFCRYIKERHDMTSFGEFGADMKVSLINDGPFTLVLDSEDIK